MLSMGYLDLVLPPRCAICRTEVPGPRPVCVRCWRSLLRSRLGSTRRAASPTRCSRCFSRQDSAGACRFCTGRHVFFDAHRALFSWSPAWRRAVSAWKFSGERGVSQLFRGALLDCLPDLAAVDAVSFIFTPLRRRSRSFEPVQDLISLFPAGPCAATQPSLRVVFRKLSSARQSGRTFQERFLAVRGTIALAPGQKVPRSVLFVDDLFTTGATANEAARLLRKAGAEKVQVLSMVMREDLDFS